MRRQFGVIATVLALTLGTVSPANALFFSQPKRETYTVNECLAALDKQAKKSPSRARSIIGAGLGVLGAIAGGSLAVSSFTCGSMFSGLAGLGIAGGAGMMAYKSFKGIAHYKANVEAHDIAKSILESQARSAQTKLLGEVSLTRDFTGSYLEVINKIQKHSEDEEVISKEEYQKFCVKIDGKSFREALAKGINSHGFIPKDAAEELKRKHPALYNKMVLANPELGEVVPVKEKKEEQAKLQKQPELPAVEEQAPVQAEKKKGLWGKIKGFFHFGKSSPKQVDQVPLTQTQPSFMTTSRDGSAQEVAPVSATTASSSSSQFAFPRFSQFFNSSDSHHVDVQQIEDKQLANNKLRYKCDKAELKLKEEIKKSVDPKTAKSLLWIRQKQFEQEKLLDLSNCTLMHTLQELTKEVDDKIMVDEIVVNAYNTEELQKNINSLLFDFRRGNVLNSLSKDDESLASKRIALHRLKGLRDQFDYVLEKNDESIDKEKIKNAKLLVEKEISKLYAPALSPEMAKELQLKEEQQKRVEQNRAKMRGFADHKIELHDQYKTSVKASKFTQATAPRNGESEQIQIVIEK